MFLNTSVLLTAVFLTLVNDALAVPPFEAICRDVKTHSFRAGTDSDGKPFSMWGDGENLDTDWVFEYDGYDIKIDDKIGEILVQASTHIIFHESGTSGLGSTSYLYAVHPQTGQISASVVNAYSLLGHGVTANIFQLECEFSSKYIGRED